MIYAIVISLTVGMAVGVALERRFTNLYRRWYLMCRDAIESGDPEKTRAVLDRIGKRTSKVEPWEEEWRA